MNRTLLRQQIELERQQQQAAAAADYLSLVVASAAGEEIDPEQAKATLKAAGKSIDQFDADCARRERLLQIVPELPDCLEHARSDVELTAMIKSGELECEHFLAQQEVAKADHVATKGRIHRSIEKCRELAKEAQQLCTHAENGRAMAALLGEFEQATTKLGYSRCNMLQAERELIVTKQRSELAEASLKKNPTEDATHHAHKFRDRVKQATRVVEDRRKEMNDWQATFDRTAKALAAAFQELLTP